LNDDARLAAAAIRKGRQGKKPTRAEAAALKRVQKARDEEARDAAYRAVPKKFWCQWSGRQYKQLADLVARYGCPLAGRSISLPDFVAWFHDWIATNGPRLPTDDKPTAIDQVRVEQAKIRALQRRRLEGELVAVAEIQRGLDCFAAHIRRAGELMEKRADMTGPEAADELARALDNAQREFRSCLPDDRTSA